MKAFLFWLLSLTWGCIMTFIGLIIALILILTGHKPKRFHYLIHFEVGESWGGVNFGPVFITDNTPTLHTKQHESGHGLQNIMLGVFMPFVVAIPSAIRYWVREIKIRKGQGVFLKPYDSIWFEYQASYLGGKFFK